MIISKTNTETVVRHVRHIPPDDQESAALIAANRLTEKT